MRRFLAAMFCVLISMPVYGGKYNSTLSVGDKAPELTGLVSSNGEEISFQNFEDAEVLILAFTCNTCPYAVDYEDRVIALVEEFANHPVKLVGINCNAGEKDSLEAMAERSAQKKFPFAYLKDPSGTLGRNYGALRTPEFVVLDRARKVVYLGAFDDDPQGKNVTHRHVEQAIQAVLNGNRPEVTETPPIGCAIKYPRERSRAR